MKACSSSTRPCRWGTAGDVAHRYQVGHKRVYECIRRRCLTGVDSRSKGLSKFVSIDEESNHEIGHVLCLGEANCAAYETLDSGPQIAVFALNFLGVRLASLLLRGIEMPRGGPPAVGGKLRAAKRGQQLLELQEDVVLAPSEHLRQDLARVRIHGVPPPARGRFAVHVTPHFVQL
jgi:hypothetical protein